MKNIPNCVTCDCLDEARFKREFSDLVEEAWTCWKDDPQTLEKKMLGTGS